MAASHREVAASLARELAKPGAVVAVTGEAGLGKTTLADAVVADLAGKPGADGQAPDPVGEPHRHAPGPGDPDGSPLAATSMSLISLGAFPAVRATRDYLVIDDAHDIPFETLRGLSAVLGGVADPFLPRIVLVGRPEFWSKLAHPDLAGLRERIALRAVLFPMSYTEAEDYVEHLFNLAGSSARSMLAADALHALLLRSKGNLRRINKELETLLAAGQGKPRPQEDWSAAGPSASASRGQAGTLPARGRSKGRWAAAGLALGAVALAGVAGLLPALPLSPMVSATAPSGAPTAPAASPARSPAPLVPPQNPPAAEAQAIPSGAAAPDIQPPTVAPAPPEATPSPQAGQPAPAAAEAAAEPAPAPPVPTDQVRDEAAQAKIPLDARDALAATAVQPPPLPPPAAVATAPAEPTAQPTPRPASPDVPGQRVLRGLPDAVVATLLQRGEAMLGLHDVSAARRLFERAALAGSAQAATALGKTYDPGQRPSTPWDAGSDPAVAAGWYQLAVTLGDEEARQLLERLNKGAAP